MKSFLPESAEHLWTVCRRERGRLILASGKDLIATKKEYREISDVPFSVSFSVSLIMASGEDLIATNKE
ncbi:MAG: hypothetical protein ABSG68_26065 [Thermoguttaceae bacterium]